MSLTVSLIKKPYEISFTGNAMNFIFSIAPYSIFESSQNISLTVAIELEQISDSDAYVELRSQSFYPDNNGLVKIDVSSILHPYLEYYIPRPTLNVPVEAVDQCKKYRLKYTLQKGDLLIGSLTTSDEFYALKGGLSEDMLFMQQFFEDFIITNQNPLSFKAKGETIGADEMRFLFWLYTNENTATNYNQYVIYTITFDDNSTVDVSQADTVTMQKYRVGCCNAGFNAMGLDAAIPAGRVAVSYSVNVFEEGGVLIAYANYYLDQRNFYRTTQLLYRNSIGGIETIKLRGQIDFKADYARNQANKTTQPEFFKNLNLSAQTLISHIEETPTYKGDTGFLSREAAEKLRDLFISNELFEYANNKLLPAYINGKSVTFFSNKDNLISINIEWVRAYINKQFTPQNIFGIGTSCPNVENLSVVQRNRNTLQISWSLQQPYDKIEVWIDNGTDVIENIYDGNAGSVLQNFDYINATVDVKARTICDDSVTPMDTGAWTYLTINVSADSPPIANDDVYNIATGYSASVTLIGSVLSNDYDPDGDAIEVVAAAGATTAGGTYSINTAGIVTYTPPASNYIGTDSFVYNIKNVGGATNYPATCYINVGNTTAFVYAKMFNITSGSGRSTKLIATIKYFSNPQGTVPIDITSKNLTINYLRKVNPGPTTSYSITGTGVENIVYTGPRFPSNPSGSGFTVVNFSMAAGTGYSPI